MPSVSLLGNVRPRARLVGSDKRVITNPASRPCTCALSSNLLELRTRIAHQPITTKSKRAQMLIANYHARNLPGVKRYTLEQSVAKPCFNPELYPHLAP